MINVKEQELESEELFTKAEWSHSNLQDSKSQEYTYGQYLAGIEIESQSHTFDPGSRPDPPPLDKDLLNSGSDNVSRNRSVERQHSSERVVSGCPTKKIYTILNII